MAGWISWKVTNNAYYEADTFEVTYYVMSVTRTMSMEEGYSMSFEAQNSTPDLEQAVGNP